MIRNFSSHRRAPMYVGKVLGTLLFLLPGCSWFGSGTQEAEKKAPPPDVALSIDDRHFSKSHLNLLLTWRMGGMSADSNTDEVKSRLLEDFIDEQLLDLSALKAGVTAQEAEIQSFLQQMDGEKSRTLTDENSKKILQEQVACTIRTQKYITGFLTRDFKTDGEAIHKYYNDHLQEFNTPETVHVKEILVYDEVEAERILSLLRSSQGKNFEELARKHSKAPSAENGGDMGFFARGDLPEELEKVFFQKLRQGRIGPVFQTVYGYHIFLLMERTKPAQKTLDAAFEEIGERLKEEYQKRATEALIDQLIRETSVKIYRNRLDFRYNGDRFAGGFFE